MIRGIHHAGLSVEALDRALEFYRSAAALERVAHCRLDNDAAFAALTGLRSHTAELVLLRGTNAFLLLSNFATPVPAGPVSRPVCEAGITHICSQHRDISALESRYRAAGADFHNDPVALGTGTIYAYVRDHEHNVIELEGTHYAPDTSSPWLNHIAIATPNVDRLAGFYAGVLELPVSRGGEFGGNALIDRVTGLPDTRAKAAWIDGANQVLEIWQYLNPRTVARETERPFGATGYTHLCLEVDDIDVEYGRLGSLGARFLSPPRDFHGAAVCLARDPDGNLLALLQPGADQTHLSLASVAQPEIVGTTHAGYRAPQAAPA